MSAHLLALALRVVEAAARLAPASERAALLGEWRAELWHRAHRLQREGRWTLSTAAALLLRSLGSVPDALDLRLCGPDGAADPWVEGRRIAGTTAALLCAALGVAVGAITCALASTLLTGGAPAWTRIDGAARTLILTVGALCCVALVASSALAAHHLARPAPVRWITAASGLLGLTLALLVSTRAPAATALTSLPARTAVAWLAVWSTSALAFAALRRRRATLPARASPEF